MTNIIKTLLLLSLCVCLGMSSGCGKNTEPQETDTARLLQGTEWRLTGFVEAKTETVKKVEPDDDNFYLLTFSADNTFTGKAYSNNFYGEYAVDYRTYSIKIVSLVQTKIAEHYDGEIYMESLRNIQSFSIKDNVLNLYYNNKKNYLRFKIITK